MAAKSRCPNTKLIASGYSQGCQIVHHAISQLDATTASWISSVLLFGDPRKWLIPGSTGVIAKQKQWTDKL